jgi:hypothetical protein
MKNFNILGLLLILFFSGCTRPDLPPFPGIIDPNASNRKTINNIFNLLKKQETFDISASNTSKISTKNDIQISFPSGCFIDEAGSVVRSGSVRIEIIDMLKPGDMIANNATTIYRNQPLISQGQFYIQASQNGKSLRVNPANRPLVSMPSEDNSTMNLFYGQRTPIGSLSADSTINWTQNQQTVNLVNDSSTQSSRYLFNLDSLKFVNLDIFANYSAANLTSIKVKIPSTFTDTNSYVFIHLKDIKSVSSLYDFDKTSQEYSTGSHYKIPINFAINIIFIGRRNNQYFYSSTSHIVEANKTYAISPTAWSLEAIKVSLNGL